MRFALLRKSHIPSMMEVDMCQDRGHDGALGEARHRVEHLAVRVEDTRFSPLLQESQEWSILSPQPQHLPQPPMINVVEGALDVRFYDKVV